MTASCLQWEIFVLKVSIVKHAVVLLKKDSGDSSWEASGSSPAISLGKDRIKAFPVGRC